MPGEVPKPAETSKVIAVLAARVRVMMAILKNVMATSLEMMCNLLQL